MSLTARSVKWCSSGEGRRVEGRLGTKFTWNQQIACICCLRDLPFLHPLPPSPFAGTVFTCGASTSPSVPAAPAPSARLPRPKRHLHQYVAFFLILFLDLLLPATYLHRRSRRHHQSDR